MDNLILILIVIIWMEGYEENQIAHLKVMD